MAFTCSKLIVETLEQSVKCVVEMCRSGVFIFNFDHISHSSSVSIVNFEYVIAGWDNECSEIFCKIHWKTLTERISW